MRSRWLAALASIVLTDLAQMKARVPWFAKDR
jgi:hypothetical protein